MKILRHTGIKTIVIFLMIGIMTIPAIISIGQKPAAAVSQQTPGKLTDADYEKFAEVYLKANELQGKHQETMLNAIKNAKLTPERFNEILSSQLDPAGAKATAEEQEAFQKAYAEVEVVQKQVETEVGGFIQKELGLEKYQQVIEAYKNDPNVQKKIESILESSYTN